MFRDKSKPFETSRKDLKESGIYIVTSLYHFKERILGKLIFTLAQVIFFPT